MKRFIILLLSICSFSGYGQQIPPYALLQENWLLENPASLSRQYLLGSRNSIVSTTGRYQWSNLGDSPRTLAATYQTVIEEMNIALGGGINQDKTGAIGTTGAFVNFAYLLNLGKNRHKKSQFLSVGLNLGVQRYGIDLSQISFAEPDNVNIPLDNLQLWYPDFSFGIHYYLDNTVFAGFSVPQVFSIRTQQTDQSALDYERIPHFLLSAGGYIPLSKRDFITPQFWVRYVENAPLNVNLNLRFNYGHQFYLGGGGSSAKVFRVESGFGLPYGSHNEGRMTVGIAYEFYGSSFRNILGNTFEIHLNHSWGNSHKVICPQWF